MITSLELEGHVTSLPFATQTITEPTPHLTSALPTYPTTIAANTTAANFAELDGGSALNPFQPFATGAYPTQVTAKGDHPVPLLNIVSTPAPKPQEA